MLTTKRRSLYKTLAFAVAMTLVMSAFITTGILSTNAATTAGCSEQAWESGSVYTGGNIVCHTGHHWKAKWWTQGEEPGSAVVWEDVGACPNGGTVKPTPNLDPKPFKISGTVAPDVSYVASAKADVCSGFTVTFKGYASNGGYLADQVATTDENGYFEKKLIGRTYDSLLDPNAGGHSIYYTMVISKPGYLKRTIIGIQEDLCRDVLFKSPIALWPGDMNDDAAVNMTDVMAMVPSFNTSKGNTKYNADCDFNKDSAVNMTDIMTVVKYFNKTSDNYPKEVETIVIAPTTTPTTTTTITPTTTPTPTVSIGTPPPPGKRMYVGYASTWNTSIDDLRPEIIPNYFTHVNLAFAKPDTKYQKGSYAFDQAVAGFEFVEGATTFTGQKKFTSEQAQTLRNNIAALRTRGTEVWVSIGGWAYSQGSGWSNFSAPNVVDLALDLGASGIDVDWESSGSTCKKGDENTFSCSKDGEIIGIITKLHNEIRSRGANIGISIAGWSTGAYYVEGTPFEEGKVQWGSPFGGTMYRVVKDHGDKIDHINLMSYDGGSYYDPREGYESYRAIYDGPINMGIEIAPEGSGGCVLKLEAEPGTVYDAEMLTGQNNMATKYYNVETLVNYIKHKGKPNDGFMVWQIWKERVYAPAPDGAATINSASQYICKNLPLRGDPNQTVPDLPKLTP